MKKEIDNKKNKEIKFVTKELKNTSANHDNSAVVTFIVALVVILLLVAGLYYVNAKFVTKDKYQDDTTSTTTTEVSYDPTIILASDILKQSEKEYMVILYDKSLEGASFYNSLVSGYQGDTKLYTVDLSIKSNEKYYAKNGDINLNLPSKVEDLYVKDFTLVYVKKGKITNIVAENNEIYSAISGTKIN